METLRFRLPMYKLPDRCNFFRGVALFDVICGGF